CGHLVCVLGLPTAARLEAPWHSQGAAPACCHPGARNLRAGAIRRSADGHQATASARLLRHQPTKPIKPRPVPKGGRAAGSGVAATFNSILPLEDEPSVIVWMKGKLSSIKVSVYVALKKNDGKNTPGVG